MRHIIIIWYIRLQSYGTCKRLSLIGLVYGAAMFDHVADRDDDNKRASERGAGGTTRRTVDVHIGDIEGERGRERERGGRGLLSAWMANCIHNHGAVQSKEGGNTSGF